MSMPVETSDWGSRSTTRVLRPLAKAAEVSPSVTVVFPTPPLRELTLSTCTSNDDTFTSLKEPKCWRVAVAVAVNWVGLADHRIDRAGKGPHVHEDPCSQPR